MSTFVCRVCLERDVAMYRIENIQLLVIFKKLTSFDLNTDGRPNTICFICLSHLKRCLRFSEMAHRSELILKDDLYNREEVAETYVSTLNLGTEDNFSVNVALIDNYSNYDTVKYLKVENVKEETRKDEELANIEESELFEEEGNIFSFQVAETSVSTLNLGTEDNFSVNVALIDNYSNNDTVKYLKVENVKEETRKDEELANIEESKLFEEEGNIYDLKQPKAKSRNMEILKCKKCNEKFVTKTLLRKHMKVHAKVKPYTCCKCNKPFRTQTYLDKHMKTHAEENPYICDRCSKQFNNGTTLKKHIERIHLRIKLFTCEVCHRKFFERFGLNLHMRIHTGEKPLACDKCEMTFAFRNSLTRHNRVAHREKPFACNMCHMTFAFNWDLKIHMRIHTGEKPYICNICGYQFAYKDKFKRHVMIHTGERPYACEGCSKTFCRRYVCLQHMKSCKTFLALQATLNDEDTSQV